MRPGEQNLPSLRTPIVWSVAVVAVVFGLFGAWSATMQLSSAAIAPGVVIVENRRARVQHFEGGIVAELPINEGDLVQEGDTLLVLTNAEQAANLERLTVRQMSLEAERLRLVAELDGDESLDFGPLRDSWPADPELDRAIELHTQLFDVRRAQLLQSIQIAEGDLDRARESVLGIDAQLAARQTQMEITRARFSSLEAIQQRGAASQFQVDDLRAQVAGLTADLAQLESARRSTEAEIEQKIGEIDRIRSGFLVRSGDRLNSVELELRELVEERVAALDIVGRTRLAAPISGYVVGLTINSPGAVVASGDVLMEIVPAEDTLVVEALIRPEDIDVVHTGLPVDVRLTALSFRNTLPLNGTLTQVSADRIVDGRSGAAIYKGIVSLDISADEAADGATLYPGMGAEVVIKTGERTLIGYLLDPISQSISRALREG